MLLDTQNSKISFDDELIVAGWVNISQKSFKDFYYKPIYLLFLTQGKINNGYTPTKLQQDTVLAKHNNECNSRLNPSGIANRNLINSQLCACAFNPIRGACHASHI